VTKKSKITEEIFPINYPHNKTGIAAPTEITRGELHVFEREGKSPVFVVFESPEIEKAMSAGLITEPEPRERLKAPDYWTEGKMPKVSIEDVMKALHDNDKEPER
jgi:hypothetical protein